MSKLQQLLFYSFDFFRLSVRITIALGKKKPFGPLSTCFEVAVASARGEQLEQVVRWMSYVFGDLVTTFQDPLIVYVTQCGELSPNYF